MNIDLSNIKIDFIGIGAQKSATTWIFRMLKSHPGICMGQGKEVHYFDWNFTRDLEWYHSHFDNCSPDKELGEYSVSYLSNQYSAQRIYDYKQSVKLIVSLRNPVDRAISHVNHLLAKDKISHDDSLDYILEKHPEIIENGLYGKHLQRYFERFEQDQIHIIKFKDIVDQPEEVVASLYKFLDVDPSFEPNTLKEKYNTTKARTSYLWQHVKKAYLKLRDNKYGQKMITLLKGAGIDQTTVKNILQMSPSKPKREFTQQEREYLTAQFSADQKQLQQICGVHLL